MVHWGGSIPPHATNNFKTNNMKTLMILAKVFNTVMGTSVGVAIAFALYKVVTNQVGGMTI